jgi:acetaldehyde dehydrogenase/alcohol dehydrogenase
MAIGNASVGINHALAHALGARFDIPHGRSNAVYLLDTIDYNSQIPSKFVSIPCYPLWIADRKYARAAQFIGLTDSLSAEEVKNNVSEEVSRRRLVQKLRQAIYDLAKLAKQPLSVAELGIPLDQYMAAIPEMTEIAFSDMSIRSNPRYALAPEVAQLFGAAYAPKERP